MTSIEILYPAFAMFFLTMGCIALLGVSRYRAIHSKQVKVSFYRTYNEGTQPKRLHILSRHVQNHFEVPPLFYLGVLIAYMSKNDLSISLIFAWLFVGARVVHTAIHLGSNNVSIRFFTFGFSLICLLVLWCTNLYVLLS